MAGAFRDGKDSRAAGLLCCALLCAAMAGPAGARPEPRSALRRPDTPGAVFVAGHLSVGGTLEHDFLRAGGGASLIFRPNAAADLFSPLYDWNTALVLQGDWRSISRDRRLFGLAMLLRRYVRDRRVEVVGSSPFLGIGLGGGEGTFPAADPAAAGVRSWLWLAEAGWETSPNATSLFFARIQWHIWQRGPLDYTGWSLQFGAGVPIPW
ncbi:MAG: hypothetical protein ACYDIE_14350 [Candidatus Krumholzibacteriia bacterium]